MTITMPAKQSGVTPGRAYSRMVGELLTRIERGELGEGDRIAPANELSEQYGISINSVRRGVKELERRGLLVRRQGSGTYVQAPASTPPAVVARTQVAVLWHTTLQTYHPYFSELRRGVQEALQQQGWTPWSPTITAASSSQDIAWNQLARHDLLQQLTGHPGIAGAIVGSAIAENTLADTELPFPVVAEARNSRVPFAAYDWADETDTALRCLLRQGCRDIAVLKLRHDLSAHTTLTRACAAEGIAPDSVRLQALPDPAGGRVLSHWIRDSYAIVSRFLETARSFDGLLIGDEFCAQGALDAIAEQRRRTDEPLPIALLASRESRLQTSLPYSAVIADGFLHGKSLVELLLDHLRSPDASPPMVVLRGTLRLAPRRRQS